MSLIRNCPPYVALIKRKLLVFSSFGRPKPDHNKYHIILYLRRFNLFNAHSDHLFNTKIICKAFLIIHQNLVC